MSEQEEDDDGVTNRLADNHWGHVISYLVRVMSLGEASPMLCRVNGSFPPDPTRAL